jgi:hypothetical protein
VNAVLAAYGFSAKKDLLQNSWRDWAAENALDR